MALTRMFNVLYKMKLPNIMTKLFSIFQIFQINIDLKL